MINIGIVGFGNVVVNVHFPVLMGNDNTNVVWVVEPNPKKSDRYMLNRLRVPLLGSIFSFEKVAVPDIVLISCPYGARHDIYKEIKGKVKGVYCEKPFARSVKEHNKYTNGYEDYEFTVGYQRRALGHVKLVKDLIEGDVFGDLQKVYFGFGGFGVGGGELSSNLELAGGGLLFEAGVHWIDTVLYTVNASGVCKITSNTEYQGGLDIHVEAEFKIALPDGKLIDFCFVVTRLKEVRNKIVYVFKNVSVELELFDDAAKLVICSHLNPLKKFCITSHIKELVPNSSLGQAIAYWDDYLDGFTNKRHSYVSANESLLTTMVIESIYES